METPNSAVAMPPPRPAVVHNRPEAPNSTLTGLGARLRQARRDRGMSQERLAQPEFTKSYVSAVERGKARPSLKALELMARRLDVPVTELLAAAPSALAEPDLPALNAELGLTLAEAGGLITSHQAGEALRRLNAAETTYGETLALLDPVLLYNLRLLRAQAYLHLGEPATARHELATALTLAAQLADDEAAERARNVVGVAFYHQEMPRLALEQHQQCRQAIAAGVVRDPHLRLSIYHHLVQDYRALGEDEWTQEIQKEAGPLFDSADNLERQAAQYWELSRAAREEDPDRARRYAEQALAIGETADNLGAAAEMNVHMAAIRIGQQKYADAERLLGRAGTLLQTAGNDLLRSTVAEQGATLELARGNRERAAELAAESLRLSERAYKALPKSADALARTTTIRAYARALRVAGLVAEGRQQTAEADKLFRRAIDVLGPEHGEIGSEIELAYAELLASRGAHEQASPHYRAAFRHRQRPAAI